MKMRRRGGLRDEDEYMKKGEDNRVCHKVTSRYIMIELNIRNECDVQGCAR